eukprot:403360361
MLRASESQTSTQASSQTNSNPNLQKADQYQSKSLFKIKNQIIPQSLRKNKSQSKIIAIDSNQVLRRKNTNITKRGSQIFGIDVNIQKSKHTFAEHIQQQSQNKNVNNVNISTSLASSMSGLFVDRKLSNLRQSLNENTIPQDQNAIKFPEIKRTRQVSRQGSMGDLYQEIPQERNHDIIKVRENFKIKQKSFQLQKTVRFSQSNKLDKLINEEIYFNIPKIQVYSRLNIEQVALKIIDESRNQAQIVWPKIQKSKSLMFSDLPRISQKLESTILTPLSIFQKNPQDKVLSHKLTIDNRAKMVDWMIQVYKIMNKSCPQTFFLGLSIMDRYFIEKNKQNIVINKIDLHLIGLCSLHISSKFEDVIPIYMSQILLEIAHGKFTRSEVMDMEYDILKTLGFKIKTDNILEESMILLKKIIYNRDLQISKSLEQNLLNFLTLISQVTAHSYSLLKQIGEEHDLKTASYSLVNITLQFIKGYYQDGYEQKYNKLHNKNKLSDSGAQVRNLFQLNELIKDLRILQNLNFKTSGDITLFSLTASAVKSKHSSPNIVSGINTITVNTNHTQAMPIGFSSVNNNNLVDSKQQNNKGRSPLQQQKQNDQVNQMSQQIIQHFIEFIDGQYRNIFFDFPNFVDKTLAQSTLKRLI